MTEDDLYKLRTMLWTETDFDEWLRHAMEERRLTLRHVAMRTGLSHTTIYHLAKGTRRPTLATALALMRLFDREEHRA